MIRLALLRPILAVSKAFIAISDLLKPTTWKRIAIVNALVGVSFLLGYGIFDLGKPEISTSPVQVAKIEPIPFQASPRVHRIELSESPRCGRGFNISITGNDFSQRTAVVRFIRFQESADTSERNIDIMPFNAGPFVTNSEASQFARNSIGNPTPDGWRLPSIDVHGTRVIFSQGPSTSTWSLLETCVKLLLLFQGITGIVNSSLATVFALIAYNRGKVDLKVKELDLELKRLQILQLQQQLDKQAQERQKEIETAARSSIVLIS